MIVAETVVSMQKPLIAKHVDISIGSIRNLKPSFVTHASEKGISLSLCKIHLNSKLMFDILMNKAKNDGDERFESKTAFLSGSSTCSKS